MDFVSIKYWKHRNLQVKTMVLGLAKEENKVWTGCLHAYVWYFRTVTNIQRRTAEWCVIVVMAISFHVGVVATILKSTGSPIFEVRWKLLALTVIAFPKSVCPFIQSNHSLLCFFVIIWLFRADRVKRFANNLIPMPKVILYKNGKIQNMWIQ